MKIKILIYHIDQIETTRMSFYGDIWFGAYTGDCPSHSEAFGNLLGESTERPQWEVDILNALENSMYYIDKHLPRFVEPKTNCWYQRDRIRGRFAQHFDLHTYPFDHHELELVFILGVDQSIATWDEDNVIVRMLPSRILAMGGTDWNVFDPKIRIRQLSAVLGGSVSGKRYYQCLVKIPIARKWKHYIYDVLFPLWLIEICC